jgi:hypothetical protein
VVGKDAVRFAVFPIKIPMGVASEHLWTQNAAPEGVKQGVAGMKKSIGTRF